MECADLRHRHVRRHQAAFDARTLNFLTTPLSRLVSAPSGHGAALGAGALLALLAAAVNNLPASLIGVLVLRQAQMVNHIAIYVIILAVDIGPKLTPFGSLATLLWMGALERDGIYIGWGHFFRENWWVTVLTLAAAFGGLLLASLLLS